MKKTLLAVLAVALVGCTTIETRTDGRRLDSAQVLQIRPGVTTRQAAIDLFGAPTAITNEDGTELFLYTFKEEKVPSYFGGLLIYESRGTKERSTLMLKIRDGIVYSYKFNNLEDKAPGPR
jgi:outer membrane protein assembly factor BamE (lipoprotein component of BamABCDE complex)